MLELHNICKNYNSKTSKQVCALNDVNITLGNTGMVFILGKSGSGKSTLLNLIGGLDAPTSGTITVDGVDTAQFSDADFECYRNDYVGFVFQEFNLLSDLTVRENIALAVQLSAGSDVDGKAVAALEQVGLDKKYLDRYVNELSGGEKQRIAIARSIVKDSKLILADEPTGNLDSVNGENIWNILKRLSASKLVVVVSHDGDSAEKYADRIIRIADGAIVSDSGAATTSARRAKAKFSRKNLSLGVRLKLGLLSMRKHMFKTVSSLVVCVFSLLAFIVTYMCASYSDIKVAARFTQANDVPFVLMEARNMYDYEAVVKDKAFKYLDGNVPYIMDQVVTSKSQLLDMGFVFVGEALEPTQYSYYIMSDVLEQMIADRCYVVNDGVAVLIDGNGVDTQSLVGKQVFSARDLQPEQADETTPVLAGIIDSSTLPDSVQDYIPDRFYSEQCAMDEISRTSMLFNVRSLREMALQWNGGDKYTGKFAIRSTDNCKVLLQNGAFVDFDLLRLKDDEIVLSYEMYATVFDCLPKTDYVNSYLTEVRKIPEHTGETVQLKFYDAETGKVTADLGTVKIVGVSFVNNVNVQEDSDAQNLNIYVSPQLIKQLSYKFHYGSSVLVNVRDAFNVATLFANLGKSNVALLCAGKVDYTDGSPSVDCMEVLGEFASLTEILSAVGGILGIALVVILCFVMVHLVSFRIVDRKHDIGVLSALGTSRKDIAFIFATETVLVAIVAFVLALALAFGFAAVFNHLYCANIVQSFTLLAVDWLTALVSVGVTFVIMFIAAIIPLHKLTRLKPIDAIRDINN